MRALLLKPLCAHERAYASDFALPFALRRCQLSMPLMLCALARPPHDERYPSMLFAADERRFASRRTGERR